MKNIMEVAAQAGRLNRLISAMETAGLADELSKGGPFTVFAFTDDAVSELPPRMVDKLFTDQKQLGKLVKYHIVKGKIMAKDIARIETAKSLSGGTLSIDTETGLKVNDAKIVKADIEAANGVIHVIDRVLIPK